MRRPIMLLAVVAVILIGGSSFALAEVSGNTVNACVNTTTLVVRIRPTPGCVSGESSVSWSVTGPQGVQGAAGPAGPAGPQGAVGPQGPAGSPDTPAQVLQKIEQVDGDGSGLDASLLDGLNSTDFLRSNGKAVDADKLDGLNSTAFARRGPSGTGTIGLSAIGANSCADVVFGISGIVPGDTVVLNVTSGDSLPARLTMQELDVPAAGKLNVRICNGTNTASVADSSIGVRWYALR